MKHSNMAEMIAAEPTRADAPVQLSVEGISKSYGATRANIDLSFDIRAGEIVGLLGANGAGKSTLIKMVSGLARPDAGRLLFGGDVVWEADDRRIWGPREARAAGVRVIHQELSLCTNLTVYENFYLENAQQASFPVGIAARFASMATAALERIFPGAGIDPHARVDALSIAERQMVEIARVADDPRLSLLILDEPSSSLDAHRAEQLATFLGQLAARGVPSIYISHKLDEVLGLVSRVVVLKNGRLTWAGQTGETDIARIITHLGGEKQGGPAALRSDRAARQAPAEALFTLAANDPFNATDAPIEFMAGEVIGFAGLEGQGQAEMLRDRLFDPARTAFVSGDRKRDGILAEASVLENAAISLIAGKGMISRASYDRAEMLQWFDRLNLGRERVDDNITTLSGGNQQKALMIRAIATEKRILLLDDPTRGVDIGVKQEFYTIIRQTADRGRLVVWNSSEDAELVYCDRVLVFREGRIVKILDGQDADKAAIVEAAFVGPTDKSGRARSQRPLAARVFDWIAPVSLVLLLAACVWLNPRVMSYGGLSLVIGGAVPLVFAAAAQMFIVSGSQIDLGMGAFMSLVSVVTATLLVDDPATGAMVLLAIFAAYVGTALIITLAALPSIIATLGFSFVWLGTGYIIQDVPGGSSPVWLSAFFDYPLPFLPMPIAISIAAAVAAIVVNRSTLGIVLRGFGNNPAAMQQAGWSPILAQAGRYAVAGAFAVAGGMTLTAIYTASDINAGNSLTLLSVAALVMGGSMLAGGIIGPAGTICAAIALTLVSLLLGQLNVGADYSPMVQGGLMIGILVIRTALGRSKA